MLAKLIAHAPTRDAADRSSSPTRSIAPSASASTTNRAFLARVLRHPAFAAAAATTAFLAEHVRRRRRALAMRQRLRALEASRPRPPRSLPREHLPPLWRGWTSSTAVGLQRRRSASATRRDAWTLIGHAAPTSSPAAATLRTGSSAWPNAAATTAGGDGRTRWSTAARSAPRFVPRRRRAAGGSRDGAELAVRGPRLVGAAPERRRARPATCSRRCTAASRRCWSAPARRVEAGALLVVMEAMKMEHQHRARRAPARSARSHAQVGDAGRGAAMRWWSCEPHERASARRSTPPSTKPSATACGASSSARSRRTSAAWDEAEHVSARALPAAPPQAGLLGLGYPEEYGGTPADMLVAPDRAPRRSRAPAAAA